jgi:glucoamylase
MLHNVLVFCNFVSIYRGFPNLMVCECVDTSVRSLFIHFNERSLTSTYWGNMKILRLQHSLVSAGLITLVAMMPTLSWAAPATGGPGATSVWSPSTKSMVGTSATDTSRVYFTGYKGIISEVFWPTLDTKNTTDLQFLVGDTAKTFVDEEKLQPYTVTRPDSKALVFEAKTHNTSRNWRITKRVFTDPDRDTLVMRVTFEALNGKQVKDFNLYMLHNPSVDNSGASDKSRTQVAFGRTMLVASQNSRASALAVSRPWKLSGTTPMVSHGYVGVNDGYTDLLGGSSDKTMNNLFESAGFGTGSAGPGNIAQMGLIDLGNTTATSISFDVALGFGLTESAAMNSAVGSLGAAPATIENTYKTQWNTYANSLSTQGGLADAQYYLAAMTLKASQDKSNGAMIAAMGMPWGDSQGDFTNDGLVSGGYHLVWARDLYKFANALINAGDTASANKAVSYLFNVQMQTTNCGDKPYVNDGGCTGGFSRIGRFPQNSWISGFPYWRQTQMDQQAMPILLAVRLNRNDLWPKVKQTADYLANNGPFTAQERWEEQAGYSPSTIAAQIAGLTAAAKMARANNDAGAAAFYLQKADYWQQKVDGWTFTNSGPLGNGRYYIRITRNKDPQDNANQEFNFDPNASVNIEDKNGGGLRDQKRVIDGGFLELVRKGVKDANHPAILETLPEYDATIGQTLSGNRPAWFRYNFDGYGEKNPTAQNPNGANYDGSGVGRLWPIFTAERGMYEILKAGNVGGVGTSYLNALRTFSTPEGYIPEQIWSNTATLLDGWQVTTPNGQVPGAPSRSIGPLNWSMGEYINLMHSIANNKMADVPNETCSRYSNCLPNLTGSQSRVRLNVTLSGSGGTVPGQHVYVVGNTPELGNWNPQLAVPVDPRSYPTWFNTLAMNGGAAVQYKYIRRNLSTGEVKWENLSGNRTLTMPAAGGSAVVNDTVTGWQP